MRFLFQCHLIFSIFLLCSCHDYSSNSHDIKNEPSDTIVYSNKTLSDSLYSETTYRIVIHSDTSILRYRVIESTNGNQIKSVRWDSYPVIEDVDIFDSTKMGKNTSEKLEYHNLHYNDFIKQIAFFTHYISKAKSFDSLRHIEFDVAFLNDNYGQLDSISRNEFGKKLWELNSSIKIKKVVLKSTFILDINRLFSAYGIKIAKADEAKFIINKTPFIGGSLGLTVENRP